MSVLKNSLQENLNSLMQVPVMSIFNKETDQMDIF